jgi:hypothetical protein
LAEQVSQAANGAPPEVSSNRALRACRPFPLYTQSFEKPGLLQSLVDLTRGDLAKHRAGLFTDLALEPLAGFQGWSDMDWHYLHPPFELLVGWARAFTASITTAPAVVTDIPTYRCLPRREEDGFISAQNAETVSYESYHSTDFMEYFTLISY